MINNNIEAINSQTTRGKRGDLIGEVVEQGILWTNVKTGEQQLEHYDLEKKCGGGIGRRYNG